MENGCLILKSIAMRAILCATICENACAVEELDHRSAWSVENRVPGACGADSLFLFFRAACPSVVALVFA